MVYISPLSTPTVTSETPLHVQSTDRSPAWSEISMQNWRDGVDFETPPPAYRESLSRASSRSHRTSLQTLHKAGLLTLLIMIGFWWWLSQARQRLTIYHYDTQLSVKKPSLEGLQFVDAGHPYIRYVGRWSLTQDGTRRDGSFPGTYLDISFNGSSTFLISLYNSNRPNLEHPLDGKILTHSQRMWALSSMNTTASPISLLVQIDDEEYIILPNATSIVTIREKDLDARSQHVIRIIAPMIGRDTIETFQFMGVWIDEEGQILPTTNPNPANEAGLGAMEEGRLSFEHGAHRTHNSQRKMLEILTDLPGSMTGRDRRKHHLDSSMSSSILGGVMGWEYLIGEMFGSDHVTIGMDGMCLVQDCVGGRGSPTGLADIFFQSGPLGTDQHGRPWPFQEYIPQVIILNIGNADWESFQLHNEAYNMTMWELTVLFEDTYVSLIRAIRTLAYPRYFSTLAEAAKTDYPLHSAKEIPIFVMRPFRGQLELATHSVVDRLQFEGDKSVFWLDTSGWLNTDIDFEGRPEDQDFFLDDESPAKEWRLTERGNQRVAILLHMHVCRYLAHEPEKCVFLAPEVYQGEAVDPEAIRFDEFMRDEKERRLKKIFWVSPDDEAKI